MCSFLNDVQLPLKRCKRRGLFHITRDEKNKLALLRKEKSLNLRHKRKQLWTKMAEAETKRVGMIAKEIEELKKQIAKANNSLIVEQTS